MTVNLSALAGAGQQFFDNNGNVLSGGKLGSFEAGTTTPQPTYTTAAGNVAHTNPIILDSAGRVPSGQIWLDAGENYKFVLMTSADVTLASYDNITGINGTGIATNAELVAYDPPFTNAVQTNVEAKLAQTVSGKDFGAVGDGVADDTAALKAAFDYAIPLGVPLELEGSYLISGPIQPFETRASGGLHIVCKGNVQITVNPAVSGFSDVLYFETNSVNSATIVGGNLTIDGSNKAGRGITIRHLAATTGGRVVISARVQITNILETNAAATRENEALAVIGRYNTVVIEQPFIQNVNRTNLAGATKGISVTQLAGTCTINQPYVENVLCVSSAGVDADGIAVFGFQAGSANNARLGTAIINEPTFVNCQGRSFKGQISDVAIYRPRVRRTGAVVAIQQGVDFDFQSSGDALLHEPVYEYYETGGVSPFSVVNSSFSSVAFQQTLDNREMSGRSVGGTVYTQVQFPRYALVTPASTAKRSVAEVSGLKILPVGAFASSAVIRAIMEVNMGTVAAKADKTKLIVRNVEGPFTNINAIGYTGYTSGALDTKFSWQVTDCTSTLSGTLSRPFNSLSGTAVGEVEAFLVRDNYRFRDLLQAENTVFSFAKLVPGCKFTVNLAALVSVTNAPPWGTVDFAAIEVLQQWFAESDVVAKVCVNAADKQSMRFFTRNGGTNWSSESIPTDSAANIALAAAQVNTLNKLTGLLIYDTTNNRIMVASGSLAASPWYVVDGSAFVTPA